MNASEIIKEFGAPIIAEVLTYLAGVILLARWLLKTHLGREALTASAPRRNNMPAYTPFIPLFVWFAIVGIVASIKENFLPAVSDAHSALLDNLILCIGALTATAAIIFLAGAHFARRLKGFGLNPKTIHKDLPAAFINLLSVWPLLIAAITLTILLGQLIRGQDFQMQQHQELEMIAAYPQFSVRLLIIITAVLIMPVFEEMLFRGMFQTVLRSILVRPWLSIAIGSALFATVHHNLSHWPALFVLGMCMGYAYEKSGSLFRPIFIHALFNATAITLVLFQL